MDETVLLWLFGGQMAFNVGLAKLWWDHTKDCRDYRVAAALERGQIAADVKSILHEIGDHDSGMRGSIHKLRNEVSPFIILAEREAQRR
jgi:hypothetical protein